MKICSALLKFFHVSKLTVISMDDPQRTWRAKIKAECNIIIQIYSIYIYTYAWVWRYDIRVQSSHTWSQGTSRPRKMPSCCIQTVFCKHHYHKHNANISIHTAATDFITFDKKASSKISSQLWSCVSQHTVKHLQFVPVIPVTRCSGDYAISEGVFKQ
jgi:hypothetical protein